MDIATHRWIAAQKFESNETGAIYKRAAKRIRTWAADTGIIALGDVTADMLDLWRGAWSEDAEKRYNRIGRTSQSHFLGYLKRFFRYAVRIRLIKENPALEWTNHEEQQAYRGAVGSTVPGIAQSNSTIHSVANRNG